VSRFYEQPIEAYIEASSEKYEVLRLLSKRGGTADILLARHRLSGLLLVMKLPKQEVPYAVRALRREAAALKCLQHDHIIRMYEHAQWEQRPALMLEYARYNDIRQYYQVGVKALSLPTVIDLTRQAASAIDYMHMRGFMHRDIKPDNMLLLRPQHMVLSDLGLAVPEYALPSLKRPMGTIRYMAPEQIDGSPCRASDQYALAIVIYELLCTRPPFVGDIDEVMRQHLYSAPLRLQGPAANLPVTIEHALHKALEKDPSRRFATVEEFYLALKCCKTKLYLRGNQKDFSIRQPVESIARSPAMNTARQQLPTSAPIRAIHPAERRQKQTELPARRRLSCFRLFDLFLLVLTQLIAIILIGRFYTVFLPFFNVILLISLRLARAHTVLMYSIAIAMLAGAFAMGNYLHSVIAFNFSYLICLLLAICLSISLCVAPLHKRRGAT